MMNTSGLVFIDIWSCSHFAIVLCFVGAAPRGRPNLSPNKGRILVVGEDMKNPVSFDG